MIFGFGICPVTLEPTILKINYPLYTDGPWYVSVSMLSFRTWYNLDNDCLPCPSIRIKRSGQAVIDVSFDLVTHQFHVQDMPEQIGVGEFSPPYYISQLGDSLIISGSFDFEVYRIIYAWALEFQDGFISSCSLLFTIPHPAAWVSATNYVNAFGGTVTGCLGDVDNFLKKEKLEQIVGIVKSCSPNMLGYLNVTLKDLSDKNLNFAMKSCKETVKIRVCKGGAWERVDGALEYMPLNCVKHTLILPLLSSYSCLLEAVSEKLEIDANSRFIVTYNSDNDIVEVCDDLEVNEFMKFVVKSSRIVMLCIVECSINARQSSTTGSNQQSNFIHHTPSVNVYQTEYHATQIHQTQMPVFPGSSGLIYQNLPSYQQMHGFSENPVYVPGFLGYHMQDPQSDSTNHKSKQNSESDDESSESDEDGSESDEDEETTPVENKICKVDKFWSMPPLLKTPVLDIKKKEVMSESSRIYRGKEIMTDMKAMFKINISYSQAWRAKFYALKLLRGSPEESFAELPLYCRNLKECIIGKQDNLTIISDGAVSIALAINNVFPNVFHGRCGRHLLMNLREKCPRFISREELFWKACKAYRISDFEERFSTLRNWLPSVANKLDMIGLEKWARVHFPAVVL
nr:hypothetical protein [Tanacetum cinerariifolium]